MKKGLQLFLGVCLAVGLGGCGGSTPPPKTDTQIANDFFKSLRTQVSSIVKIDDNASNGFLDTEAENLGKDLQNVTLNASLVGKYLGAIMGVIADSIDANSDGGVSENVEEGRNVSVRKQPNFQWDYTITQNNTEIGKGSVTMPGDDLNLTLDEFDSNLSFLVIGTFPLYGVDEVDSSTGQQSAKAEIVISKEDYGALLSINELALVGDGASVKFSDFKTKTYYVDSNDINYSIFEGVKVDMTAGEYTYNGILTVPSYVQNSTLNDNDGYIPASLVYNGLIQNSTTAAKLDASLTVDWLDAKSMDLKSGESPHLKVQLNGDLVRPSFPDTKIMLGYDDPLIGDTKIVTFSYGYDQTNIEGKGVFDKEMDNGKITISGNDGIAAVVKVVSGDVVYGEENSYVTRNGTKIGYLTERNGVPVIMYNDGTFESLQ